jgi:hypothetical protein
VRAAARRTHAGDEKSVAGGTKSVGEAHRAAQLENLVVAELDDSIARRAVEMIVGRIAVVVFERTAIGQSQLAQEAGFHQQPQCPVDGRSANLVAGIVKVAKQLVGVEMLMGVENMAYKDAAGLSQLLATDLEKFAEFLDRRVTNRQRRQMVGLRFPDDSSSRDQFADLSRESCRFCSRQSRKPILAFQRANYQSMHSRGQAWSCIVIIQEEDNSTGRR